MAVMQVQAATVDKLYHLPSKHEMSPAGLKLNLGAKHFINLTFDRYITQLYPRPRLDVLKSRFLQYLDNELHIYRLCKAALMISSATPKRANTFSLLRMCRNVIITCNSDLLFGARLCQMDPHFLDTHCTFDDENWVMLYQIPRFYGEKSLRRSTEARGQF